MNRADRSAGDADYTAIGDRYSYYRRPEPVIEAAIRDALAGASTLLNVGAGAGSYEPRDLDVTAVEPSAAMRAQRPPHLAEAIDADAEHLPFADNRFDAALASFTIHQWKDLAAGLRELRRVTIGPIAILTCDPTVLQRFWLFDYAPEVIEVEAARYPQLSTVSSLLGGITTIEKIDIPLTCSDGFSEAYYGRPEVLLDPGARRANSAWSFVADSVQTRFERELRADLESGAWDARYGNFRTRPMFDGALRLIVGTE
ncbi:hypothetical protein ABH922_004472 [Rhodococcus sp. 27YEA15]|uniref:class I SAM-dependent methyltransferase n=1 Tax=Rhodococcus sp. 27YEA15 TaxID=3156259 RepID=UPI003C7ED4F8